MSAVKKVWNAVSTALVVLVVLCAIFLMGSRLLGFKVYTVLSGSMRPTYSEGDLLYVQKVNPATIKKGDPITFVLNEDLVVATHRVIRVDRENQRFYTQGDANEAPDSAPVHYNNVLGVPKFSVPLLGYVSNFIQNPPGMYITIALFAILIVVVFLPDMLPRKKKPEEKAESAAPAALEEAAPAAEEVTQEPAQEPAQETQQESPSDA